MNRFFVVEGTSCSGKTSTIALLTKKGAEIIPENSTLCKDFPPLPTNYEESRRNERFILELEKNRCLMAEDFGGLSIADRMIISSLSISYAWGFGSIGDFIDDVISTILNGSLLLPDCTVYLEASVETIQKRNLLRRTLLGNQWVSEQIINKQKYFYDVYFKVTETENIKTIATDNKSNIEIADEILSIECTRRNVTNEMRAADFIRLKAALNL